MSGRFAPSPTGALHLGNLRTALLAWLAARSTGRDYIVRMEDLDRVQAAPEHERVQLSDLAAIGLDWDGEVVRQSERFDIYNDALATLDRRGLVYECFCSRREVRAEIEASPSAPHLPPGSYPGTCRTLTSQRRAALLADGRTPALRLRASESMDADSVGTDSVDTGSMNANGPELVGFADIVAGHHVGGVDDVVLRRNDGVPSYNLAVVIDDALQGVTQVVRGDDLLDSTPRQIHLQRLLDLATPEYGHVPLVFGDDDERLSKRHGSVSIAELVADGASTDAVVAELLRSCGVDADPQRASSQLSELAAGFDLAQVTRGIAVFGSAPDQPARFLLRGPPSTR